MLKDKNGEDVTLQEALNRLQGTDANDMAASVIDFALYPVKEEGEDLGNPEFYLVGTEVIVTRISFIGPFVSLELDFRNAGTGLLQQVMHVVNQFHSEINSDDVVMLSTITPLSLESGHTLTLADPLICVRGYSDTGSATTILQLIYSADNAAFSLYEIDLDALNADVDREIQEMESYRISNEAMAAAEEAMAEDENNEAMKSMFHPNFGFRTPEGKKKESSSRIAGSKDVVKVSTKNSGRIGLTTDDDDE